MTGANSGIGLETARQLSKQGAKVILACRNVEKGTAAAEEAGGIFLEALDLSSLSGVRNFVKAFKEDYDRLDVLVNNAGIMMCPYQTTKDGFEMQIGVNHLGHFLLMRLLTPLLVETAKTTKKPSRFVTLSSVAAAKSGMNKGSAPKIDFDDLMFETRDYDEGVAYGQSKFANYLHALEASRRIPSDQLISTSNHPGWVYTPLDQHIAAKMLGTGYIARFVGEAFRKLFMLTGNMIKQVDGAQTSLHCILDDNVESGKFYSQFGIYADDKCKPGGWPMEIPNPNATIEASEKLWEVSEKLVGL